MGRFTGHYDAVWCARYGPDGTRLYYRSFAEVLMAVPITVVADQIQAGAPERLFELHPPEVGYLRNAYDPTPDGNAIISFQETSGSSPPIRIRTGWRKW